jgi:uncharacterized protein (DUF885 family)
MSIAFVALADRIVEELLATDPVLAGRAGDHRYDHVLPDYSTTALAGQVAMLRDAAAALSGVDTDELDTTDRVDHEQLMSLVDRRLFELTEVREHEWNPLVYNPGELVHALLSRPFAPAEVRAESALARVRAIPDALAVARATLRDCPVIHLETAAIQFRGSAALLRDEMPALLAQAPGLAATARPVLDAATAELERFADEMARQAETGRGARSPRLGRKLWDARLWHTLDTERKAADVLRLAWRTLEDAEERLREAAAEFLGGPADDDTVRRALDRLADERPDNETIVELARVSMAETTDFVRQRDLVSLVDDPCVIREMPEFDRGVAVAYCDSPGALEGPDQPTFYCIAPAPQDWPRRRVESFYREYNSVMVRNLTVHEAMPGHFLQLAHARRHTAPTRVRALARSGPFIEGWAVYAEELMAEYGFGGLPVRLVQLKMRLRMSINAILDQLVHCEDLSEDDAMELMTRRGFQEEGEAAGKWRRALLTSTQLSTYLVGYADVSAVAAARPAGTSPRVWHDAMLAHASPSPRHLWALLGLPRHER